MLAVILIWVFSFYSLFLDFSLFPSLTNSLPGDRNTVAAQGKFLTMTILGVLFL